MIYTSKQNPIIKEIASLKDKKSRQKSGLYIAEGIKMVNEAIKYGMPIDKIVATESALKEIESNNFPVITVSDGVFKYLSDEATPQGALSVVKIKTTKPTSSDCALILDGVSDPGNMGTIIRTACALSYFELYLINCVDPYSGKSVRASMSGIYFANVIKCDLNTCLNALNGYEIIVADANGEDLKGYKPNGKYAIVVGNEANGVSKELKAVANKVLKIPMEERSESLNVAVASAIMMYNLK
ncbi:MAG: RNA methyltransferase [Clostridia bacterium]|nr:RNA methyltransferase [Clostridia bacterium]